MTNDAAAWITPTEVEAVRVNDRFLGLDASVGEFWRFALGDLRMNNARGYLAEFIVARALGLDTARRVEWAEYDVLYEDITIEVKSSAYLQSWKQPRLSRVSFSGLKGTRLLEDGTYDPNGRLFNAMVYVFCVQTAQTHEAYDPLDMSQWMFFVLQRSVLESRGYASIALSEVQKLAARVDLSDLPTAVRAAAGI